MGINIYMESLTCYLLRGRGGTSLSDEVGQSHVALGLRPEVSAQGEGLVGLGEEAGGGVDVGDVDLNGGSVAGRKDLVGVRAAG